MRQALALDASNFLLLSHSWVGILAIEHKQRHQQPLEGLIISDMVWGMPGANRYAESVTST